MELVRAYTNSWRGTEIILMGIPGGSSGNLPASAGDVRDVGLIPG